MSSPSVKVDIEAPIQTDNVTETADPLLNSKIPNPQPPTSADPQPLAQATNTNEHHSGNPPAPQITDNLQVPSPRGINRENHGDSSDGLWSIYLTEAEKQDAEVTESWKGDTEGILVFTGLFSATVATFIIESYKTLSPDSGETTNTLLAQISGQLVNISNGTPLVSVAAQPFKPTPSAVRVNVLWFLSLVLSLNCALSATLMQQWARRYRELAQRRGAIHRRGRMRAYIFNGIAKFEMAQAVATMPRLLHISVFLFFTGLVEFLFPIYATVAYTTLGCIMVFALAYAILTVLPNIFLNCPYGTPLSGVTWRISQFSVFLFFRTFLEIRTCLSKIRSLANRQSYYPPAWTDTLEEHVIVHRQLFWQGLRKSVELSAYNAESTVVTSALEWTLTALDEDKEIEDFAARVPGFFDSRVVPDATSAVLSLMSHDSITDPFFLFESTDPIFGSRLNDLLETCVLETSVLDEQTRKNRLRVCLNCLWYFGRAYNLPEFSQPLPFYFQDTLIPTAARCIRVEKDSGARVIGRCFGASIVNKLLADIDSLGSNSDRDLECLSTILDTETHDLKILLRQPGALALANMISFMFDKEGTLVLDAFPSDVLDVVQQTLSILSQPLRDIERAQPLLVPKQQIAIIDGSNGLFDRVFLSRIDDLLCRCTAADSPLTEEVRAYCILMCLRGLWYFVRASNNRRNSAPLPFYFYTTVNRSHITRRIRDKIDVSALMMKRCVDALVVCKLAADIDARTPPVNDTELGCLSAILATDDQHAKFLLSHPGAVHYANMVFFVLDNDPLPLDTSSDVLGVIRQTLSVLSQALPDAEMQLDLTEILTKGSFSLTDVMRNKVLGMFLKNIWHSARAYIERGDSVPLPSYFYIAFTNPDIARRISDKGDLATLVTRRCISAMVVHNLAADIDARTLPINDTQLGCLSSILATDGQHVKLLLSHPGAVQLANMILHVSVDTYDSSFCISTPYALDVIRQTLNILSKALPDAEMRLDMTDTLTEGTLSLAYGMCLNNLWHFIRECIEHGDSDPLPSYVYIALTHPEITRRTRDKEDTATRVIVHCVTALVVHKLATNIKSRAEPVSDAELACLSSILDSESYVVRVCLTQPGIVELANMASLSLSHVGSLKPNDIQFGAHDVLQQTLDILTRALPAQENVELPPDQTVAQPNISDDRFERIIVSRFYDFFKMCTPGAPPLTEEVRTSCLRMSLKTLWNSARVHHYNFDPLPSYFPSMLASPEITHRFQTEQDPIARLMGRCFGALIVSKLADTLKLPVSLTRSDSHNAELACISAILGTGNREDSLLPHQLRIINFRKVVSLISDEINVLFTTKGLSTGILDITQDTLHMLASRLYNFTELRTLLQQIFLEVRAAAPTDSDQPRNQMVQRLDQLRQVLEKPLVLPETQQDVASTGSGDAGRQPFHLLSW